jgi:hypothetical protein
MSNSMLGFSVRSVPSRLPTPRTAPYESENTNFQLKSLTADVEGRIAGGNSEGTVNARGEFRQGSLLVYSDTDYFAAEGREERAPVAQVGELLTPRQGLSLVLPDHCLCRIVRSLSLFIVTELYCPHRLAKQLQKVSDHGSVLTLQGKPYSEASTIHPGHEGPSRKDKTTSKGASPGTPLSLADASTEKQDSGLSRVRKREEREAQLMGRGLEESREGRSSSRVDYMSTKQTIAQVHREVDQDDNDSVPSFLVRNPSQEAERHRLQSRSLELRKDEAEAACAQVGWMLFHE